MRIFTDKGFERYLAAEKEKHERRLQLIGDGEGLEPDENGRMRLVIRREQNDK